VHPAINRLLERSIFSDRMVFVRAVHAAKYMNDTELAIYDSWWARARDMALQQWQGEQHLTCAPKHDCWGPPCLYVGLTPS
jgi:deoxyadenosine/deoxycytidine kinase